MIFRQNNLRSSARVNTRSFRIKFRATDAKRNQADAGFPTDRVELLPRRMPWRKQTLSLSSVHPSHRRRRRRRWGDAPKTNDHAVELIEAGIRSAAAAVHLFCNISYEWILNFSGSVDLTLSSQREETCCAAYLLGLSWVGERAMRQDPQANRSTSGGT